jgi:hypothetical protein
MAKKLRPKNYGKKFRPKLIHKIRLQGEALRLGHLPWDVYLKKVRNLSRKQFFLRATMIKCRERAGLD